MTTLYVDALTGNDTTGDGLSEGTAWATINKAMTMVSAYDHVYVKASAAYTEQADVITAVSYFNAIIFEGYTSTPGDMGQVTWNGVLHCLHSNLTSTVGYIFKNFTMQNSSGDLMDLSSGSMYLFMNCKFLNAGARGLTATGSNFSFLNCEWESSTNEATYMTGSENFFVGCICRSPGTHAFRAGGNGVFYKNVIHGLSTGAYALHTTSVKAAIQNTVDGENASNTRGVYLSVSQPSLCAVDNIFHDLNIAVTTASSTSRDQGIKGYNLMSSVNTHYSPSDGVVDGFRDVVASPGFVDEANDDYRISADSAAAGGAIIPGCLT